jgi:hypothetical protein
MLYACIWEILGSNSGQITGHPEAFFVVFLTLQVNARIVPSNRLNLPPSKCLPAFTIHENLFILFDAV